MGSCLTNLFQIIKMNSNYSIRSIVYAPIFGDISNVSALSVF